MAEFSWPKKGDKLFSGDGKGKCFHLGSIWWHDPGFSRGFKEAADMMIESYEARRTRPYRDELFFPVAYLYRHCLELKLKEIIRIGVELRVLSRKEVEEAMDNHNLAKLWTRAKKPIEDCWPKGEKTPLKAVEAVINEFHQADRTGQAFRYQTDKDGSLHRHPDLPEHISITNLKQTMDAAYTFLNACYDGLFESYDAMRSNM